MEDFRFRRFYSLQYDGEQREIIVPELLRLESLTPVMGKSVLMLQEMSISLNLFSQASYGLLEWWNENIFLPRKYDNYSWICSGILLISLIILLLLVLSSRF